MKIILVSVGTRGDMEPFIAIGELLKRKGHDVILAFPEQFRNLATDSKMEFASLGSRYVNLLDSKEGRAAMGGATGFKKFVGTLKLAMNQSESNKELLFKQKKIIEEENPDRILYNGKAVYPILWKLKTNRSIIFICPLPYMHYVKGNTHIAFNSNFGTYFNKLSFSLAHFGMVTTLKLCLKWLKSKEKYRRRDILNILRYNKSIYTISPTLFPRPAEWHKDLKVLGYHQKDQNLDWNPPDGLIEFINNHDKILFITLGSMTNYAPKKITRIIIEILESNKMPAIINTASGGLVQPEQYDSELIHYVSQIPYDWILPKMYGAIHHGGSGTTHMSIKYGCATMIIPHIIDQFVWNRIVSDLGAGPKGIKINKVRKRNLEPLIMDLFNTSSYKMKARELAKQMQKEDFEDELYDTIVE